MHTYPSPVAGQQHNKTDHNTNTDIHIHTHFIRSLLIANRGEIACRVIRTARQLGIRTIAVYSDADADARFVKQADEAWRLGPAPASESYLRADLILQIARQSGADAIHPGYGFLSENEDFARACETAGIIFVGPPASAIAAMGSKSAAKHLMEQAGVPLVPGYHGDNQETAFLQTRADAIGYPVLIKASAGGGGKGMRVVEKAADFTAALLSCQREAEASFGSRQVLIEKYLSHSRHVEIQVFADQQGNTVYLFERDCSVQRRHQKVLEESPAPHLPPATRSAMGDAACAAARAVGYVGAGTVEFIMDVTSGQFYFMEMNTRLQVEHPVTEMITGQDLVEWQLKVASGHSLPLRQDQLSIKGHAFEVRIYAEDPDKGFLPSTGTLHHLQQPATSQSVRIDTGVGQGDNISPFYDPMIAKLIVHGENRDIALQRLSAALAAYQIVGVQTNIRFLQQLASHPAFCRGEVDTGFIPHHHDSLLPGPTAVTPEQLALLAVGEILAAQAQDDSVWGATPGWRLNGRLEQTVAFTHADTRHSISLTWLRGQWAARVDGLHAFTVQATLNGKQLTACLNGHHATATLVRQGNHRTLFHAGQTQNVDYLNPFAVHDQSTHKDQHFNAPMPGKVVALLVQPGQQVEKGTPLMVLEAMKMEHTITATAFGRVDGFYFQPGEQVQDGDELLAFSPEDMTQGPV